MPKQAYTAEFEEQAVKHARAVGVVLAARELGLVEQTLRHWVKASAAGKLTAAATRPVTPEPTALSSAARREHAAGDARRPSEDATAHFAKDAR